LARIDNLSVVWKNIKEIDLKPIRDSALQPIRIAVVGVPGVGKRTLAEQMRTDPSKPEMHTLSTLSLINLEETIEAPQSQLTIMLVDGMRGDFTREQSLLNQWGEAGENILVLINKLDLVQGNISSDARQDWKAARVISGSINDGTFLQKEFIPAILELLPQQQIALGRLFPLFRLTIARQLINDTCISNAAYSFSTGLAEIVPVLDLPLNVTDLMVLTKSQGFLVYKLGLLLGFSTRWQDYVTEFGSVIGGGFLWRQIARSLVGLIPAWGIVPKVAVAYAGTYAVGYAILNWYQSGRKLSTKQMQALYVQAFAQGKEYAKKLVKALPKRGLKGERKGELIGTHKNGQLLDEIIISKNNDQLLKANPAISGGVPGEAAGENSETPPKEITGTNEFTSRKERLKRRLHIGGARQDKSRSTTELRLCANCGKTSSADAEYCQYCGTPFDG
jgi:uncharacterized protein (DUF697 family)